MKTDAEKLILAGAAIHHALNTICNDPAKFWLLGNGTETYARLTEAHATIQGLDIATVRSVFKPSADRYERYCDQLEKDGELLIYCREHGITGEEES